MDNQNENMEPIERGRVNTTMVIDKFTNTKGEVDIEKMASKMSTVKEHNSTLKKILLFSSLFLVVGVCLMISSNVIGGIIMRDRKVRDNQVVTPDNKAISIDQKLYKVPVYLYTSESVLDGLKYIEVPVVIEGDNATLHMNVDSYIYSTGNRIIFIGEKYCLLIQRHNYELFLNDGSFDPISLNDTNNEQFGPEVNVTEEAEGNNAPISRSIYRSESKEKKKIGVLSTIEVHKKRHIQDEATGEDPADEFVVLNGRGSVSAPALTRASATDLLYRPGKIVTNGKVVIIVWNDQTYGKFNAPNLRTCYNALPTFFTDLLKTKLFTQLTPGKKGSDPQCRVTGVDTNVHYLTPASSRRKQSLTDSDIRSQLNEWLSVPYDATKVNSTIPKDTVNRLNYMYMIFFPSGIKLSSGFCSGYCGFHTYTNSYAYAVMPWVGDCLSSCGKTSYVSSFGGSTCGSLHSVAAHELTEIATDPYLNVYYDRNGNENADKCAWTTPACFKNPSTGNSYCIQQQWNHTASSATASDAGCSRNLQF